MAFSFHLTILPVSLDRNFDNLRYILIAIGVLLGAVVIANLYTWSRIVQALIFSQRRRLQMSVGRLQTVRAEGYLQALKREVGIMVEMVQCLDAFSGQQTRLVMVVDGLDSCEQDQVLYVLDAVHLLFTEQGFPFITLLAIDPHIIIKVRLPSTFLSSSNPHAGPGRLSALNDFYIFFFHFLLPFVGQFFGTQVGLFPFRHNVDLFEFA